MATDPQLVQITFAAGINEAVRSEAVDPQSGFLVRQNVRQPQRGVADKRPGFVARSRTRIDGTTRTVGKKTFSRAHEACVIDAHTLDSWSPAYGVNVNIDGVPELAVERFSAVSIPVPLNITTLDANMSLAYANGLYFICYATEAVAAALYNLNVVVVDATTKAVVARFLDIAGNIMTNALESRMCAVGSKVFFAWTDNTVAKIFAVSFDATSTATLATGPSAPVEITDHAFLPFTVTGGWDIAGLESSFVLAYICEAGLGSGVAVRRFSTSFSVISSAEPITLAAAQFVAVDGSENDFIWIAWGNTSDTNVHVAGLNPSSVGSITSAAASVVTTAGGGMANQRSRIGIRRTSSTGGTVVARGDTIVSGGAWFNMTSRAFLAVAGTTTGQSTQNILQGWNVYSQPFQIDGRVYALASLGSSSAMPANIVAFDITSYTGFVRPVATPARGLHKYNNSNNYAAQHIAQVSATKVACISAIESNGATAAIQIIEFDSTPTHRWQVASHNGVAYLSGGLLYGYDGAQLFEASFVAPPEIKVSDAGAGSIGAGTYEYTAIVEWPDAEGNVHWSEPAPVVSITIAANHNVDVEICGYASTWKDSIIGSSTLFTAAGRIKVFRTKAGGGVFYLIATYPLVRDIARYSTTDSATDSGIASAAQLYTTPGLTGAALVRRAPPSCVSVSSYLDQIVVIADDRRTIWVSAARVVGEGLWFNDVWQYPIPDDELVATRELDGTLYIFGRRAIFAIAGEAPSDNGATGGMGTPRRLACDVGCADPRSLCVTSKGIFFRALDGKIYILSRAQTVEWIGEAVQVTASAYPVCTGITLTSDAARVYVDLAESETSGVVGGNGITLVYDLARGLWDSTDVRTSAAATASCPAQSACVVDSGTAWVYAWLSSDGYVHLEDSSTYLDPGNTWVTKIVDSADFKVSGLQGYQHINKCILLAKNLTGHDMNLELAYDYAPTYKTAASWTRAQIDALTAGIPNEQLYHDPHDDARCEAFRVRLLDAAPSSGALGNGRGSAWVGLTIEVAPQPRTYPLPAGSG